MLLVFECIALAPLQQQHASLSTVRTDTMWSLFRPARSFGSFLLRVDVTERLFGLHSGHCERW